MKNIIIICFAFLAISCSKKRNAISVPNIVFETNNIHDNDISRMVDSVFEIIPLQTDSNCLIAQIDKIEFQKNLITVLDKTAKSVLIFDYKGNYINKIQRIGKGPEEYLDITDMTSTDSTITILDRFTEKMIVYNLNGEMIYSNNVFRKIWAHSIFHLNGILCYRNEYSNTNSGNYLLFTEGSQINRNIPFDKELKWIGITKNSYTIFNDFATLIFSGNDTVYTFHKGEGSHARYVFDFKEEKAKFRGVNYEDFFNAYNKGKILGLSSVFETSKYLIFKIEGIDQNFMCVLDKNNGVHYFCKTPFYLKDFCEFDFDITTSYKNKLVKIYDSATLIDLYESKYSKLESKNRLFKTKLTEICSQLSENDNPVIFIFNTRDK